MAASDLFPPQYIFAPAFVDEQLEQLPLLSKVVAGFPSADKSQAFTTAYRSPRQIFRLLGNTHYPQIEDLLQTLEFCLEHDIRLDRSLRTRSRFELQSQISAAFAAESMVRHGCRVRDLDRDRGNEPVADFAVSIDGTKAIVEVVCPRMWGALDQFVEDAKDVLKNLDVGFDFGAQVELRAITEFDEDAYRGFDVGSVDQALESPARRSAILKPWIATVADAIGLGKGTSTEHDYVDLNLTLTTEINNVRGAEHVLPDREIAMGYPGAGGYAAEGILRRVLTRGAVAKKLERRQADSTDGSARVLIVDVSHIDFGAEFTDRICRPKLEAVVEAVLEDTSSYDVVTFCSPPPRHAGRRSTYLRLVTHITWYDPTKDASVIDSLGLRPLPVRERVGVGSSPG